jgi:hypothetical protein
MKPLMCLGITLHFLAGPEFESAHAASIQIAKGEDP